MASHRNVRAVLPLLLPLLLLLDLAAAQQSYSEAADCSATNPPDGVYGYTCAAAATSSCSAYAAYAADATYNYTTLAAISALLGANVAATSALNAVGSTSALAAGTVVVVPIPCACAGNRTRAVANYTVQAGDTYYVMATDRFHGLSTCQAMYAQNRVPASSLQAGESLVVPIRCACPSATQAAHAVKYLLTYSVNSGDDTVSIASRFNVSHVDLLAANQLSSQQEADIFNDTTLLVPLKDKPSALASSASPPPPPPQPSATSPTRAKSPGRNQTAAIVGGVVAGAVVAAAGLCIWNYRKRRPAKPVTRTEPLRVTDTSDKVGPSPSITLQIEETGPRRYSLTEIEAATEQFAAGNQLSQSVFRGKINGETVAVKRVVGDVADEVRVLAKLSHVNLLAFRGYCSVDHGRGATWMVFEYAEKGSLATWLNGGPDERAKLSWRQRVRIAADVANALTYLHEFANPPYLHRDVCGENVLLDDTWRAKLANFQSVRSAVTELAFTSHVVGTRGFLAPEYAGEGVVTTKADVFAFGVVLAQLISGLAAVAGERILWKELWALLEDDVGDNVEEKVRTFVDESLGTNYELEAAVRMARLACACVAPDLNFRPSMDHVALALSPLI